MAAYCDMALLLFHKNEPPLPEVKTPGFRFFLPWMIPTLFQLYSNFIPTLFQLYSNFVPTLFQLCSNYSEFPNCSKLPWNPSIILSLMYQDLDYQITDVIQLNRAKSVFNRAEKKKPNTCEGVRPFPTSKRTTIK